ncbi:phosphoribosylglycinamide formyltransferase [Alphaproteobacteria bacterium]|jgi:phosphoribosylglycinamide formyltransferase-1|nr:phosphoribosylglycinamide formyltransferase [Alphaproteobacteria bacterium]
MANRLRVAVLISGRGTNLQALINACAKDDFSAEIVRVISNNESAFGLERAQAAGLSTAVIDHRDFKNRSSFEKALNDDLEEYGTELICLAGFMRLLTGSFVDCWRDRLINIHPSLLPAFKGLDTHQRTIDDGVRIAGCTVHFVRADMDAGPIIVQAAVPVLPGDDESALSARILEQEHVIFPLALNLIATGCVQVIDEIVIIDGESAHPEALVSPQLK